MSDESLEALSAAMDGETSQFELRRLLDRTEKEPNISHTWNRYHMARQALHAQATDQPQIDLVGRISAALERETIAPLARDAEEASVSAVQPWWKPLASMAVAASVTAVVILGGQQFGVTNDQVDPALQQTYTIPSVQSSKDFVRAQYGALPTQPAYRSGGSEPEVIRMSQGLDRYISQHQHLLSSTLPAWRAEWMPDGFQRVRHDVMSHAEVMVYSDGRHSVSVSVEPLNERRIPAGVIQTGDIVAVGKAKESTFVTVVGDVPLMIADRIADSVKAVR